MAEQNVISVPLIVGGLRGLAAFIVTGDRPFLVDTGIPGSTTAMLEALEAAAIAPSDVALIVLTHAHPDHAGSAAELASVTGAPVLSHRSDAEILAAGATEPVVGRTPAAKAFAEQISARSVEAASGPAYPPVTVSIVVDDEGTDLSEHGIDARIVYTPGHTAGGLTVVLGNGEALTGDLIGGEGGEPALAMFATDEVSLAASIGRVLALKPPVVHTCHDGSFRLAELLQAFDYLV